MPEERHERHPAGAERHSPTDHTVGLVLILVAAAALFYAVTQVVLAVNPGTIHLDPALAQPGQATLDVGDLPKGAQVEVVPTVSLALAEPGLALRILVHAPEAVGGLGVAAAAMLLRRVTRRIGEGNPFAPGTASAIGCWIGEVVLLVGSLVPFALAALVLCVAGAWRRGAARHEELEGLV